MFLIPSYQFREVSTFRMFKFSEILVDVSRIFSHASSSVLPLGFSTSSELTHDNLHPCHIAIGHCELGETRQRNWILDVSPSITDLVNCFLIGLVLGGSQQSRYEHVRWFLPIPEQSLDFEDTISLAGAIPQDRGNRSLNL